MCIRDRYNACSDRLLKLTRRKHARIAHARHHKREHIGKVPFCESHFTKEVLGIEPTSGDLSLRHEPPLKRPRCRRGHPAAPQVFDRLHGTSRRYEKDCAYTAANICTSTLAKRCNLLEPRTRKHARSSTRHDDEVDVLHRLGLHCIGMRNLLRLEPVLRQSGLERLDKRRIDVNIKARCKGVDKSNTHNT